MDHLFSTANGRVRGRGTASGVVAVLGIPYAAPPFGADRFKAPRPAPAWRGVRECADFGPIAPQSAELPGMPAWSPGDEDVLNLNVWTREGEGEEEGAGARPVLVWIHGGAYTFGASAQPDFDGTALVRAGLVVVTLNYRLGFEGFGHVPGSGVAGSDVPANRGLLDQIAALEWVRDNIAAFGGDPANVTVAGQSAGATSVACLTVMERARGLFRRAVAHSLVGPVHPPRLAAETTRRVAAAAGVPATAEALATASPYDLVRASDQVVADFRADPAAGARHYDPVLYGPVADGVLLPADPLAVGPADRADVDLLVCHTTEEYWLLDAVGSSKRITTDRQLDEFAADFGLPGDLVPAYRALMPDAPVLDLYLAIYGDMSFGEYSSRFAERHARAAGGGGRTYLSRFARRRVTDSGVVRPWHCADVPFAFGTLADPGLAFLIGGPPLPEDHELSHRMVRAWADFAATGDPGWQPLDPDGGPEHVRIWGSGAGEAGDGGLHGDFRAAWRTADYARVHP
ncbi:carboxylesterase/lipase family protein [Streptomyces sp. NP-1717]|uniref:carboxylesterase/lipase family protein n=1 Tax=Streptomyces sp. NP-1717 TaxID=2704470 RepID=UPI001F5D4FEB|nr:carboxylesterase family protein [Streptomyces sp. NP-1717]MCI3221372.1 carboxylesterase family protein [Streptomyces sp. NP-1717]